MSRSTPRAQSGVAGGGDGHVTKSLRSSFSIDALIATDDRNKEKDQKQEDGNSQSTLGHQRTDEVDVQRAADGRHVNSSSSSNPPFNNRLRECDDDDDDDSCLGRDDSSRRQSDRQHQTNTRCHGNHQQHLQQFQQLLSATHQPHAVLGTSLHPLIRHNFISNLSHPVANDALLRVPPGVNPAAVPTSLFCCPPSLPLHSRPSSATSGNRADELVPFYSWLLSRHGAFFNHRIHPAGITCY